MIFGDRFDDRPVPTLEIAGRLRARGTKIFAFHVGNDRNSHLAYEQLAQHNGGVFVPLTGEPAFARVLPVLTDYMFRPAETLRAPPPNDVDVRALVEGLRSQPVLQLPPSLPARLPWKR